MANVNQRNHGIIIGNVASDLVPGKNIFVNKDGSVTVKFSVYARNDYKSKSGQYESELLPVEQFIPASRAAEGKGVYEFLGKGSLVAITTRLKNQKFTANGTTHYKLVADIVHVDVLESKEAAELRRSRSEQNTTGATWGAQAQNTTANDVRVENGEAPDFGEPASTEPEFPANA